MRRRTLLRAGAVAGLTMAAGCLGGGELSCRDYTEVLSLRAERFSVRMSGEYLEAAETMEEQLRDRGLFADAFKVPERGPDEAIQIDIFGDITKDEVRRVLSDAGIEEYDLVERSVGGGPFLNLNNDLTVPWARPILAVRSAFLNRAASDAGFTLPTLSATERSVGVDGDQNLALVEAALRPRGRIAITWTNAPFPDAPDPEMVSWVDGVIDRKSIRIEGGGPTRTVSFTTGGNYEALVLTTGTPSSYDLSQAELTVTFDGEVIQRRRMTQREREYNRAYNEEVVEPGDADMEPFGRVRLPGLDPRTALRVVTALRAPTRVPLVFQRSCQ